MHSNAVLHGKSCNFWHWIIGTIGVLWAACHECNSIGVDLGLEGLEVHLEIFCHWYFSHLNLKHKASFVESSVSCI